MGIRSVMLSIILTVVLLGLLSAVLTERVVAEPNAPNTITIDTCTETNFNAALASANNGDVIHVRCLTSSPLFPETIVFSAQKPISKSITILGTHPAKGVNLLSGNDATRLFVVNDGHALTLTNITVEHGDSGGSGGCLQVYGSLIALTTTLRHCRTFGLISSPDGGAIYANGANVTLTNTTFYSNTADGDGGGLYAYNSAVYANRSRFESNVAYNHGGGYYQRLGSLRFDATTLTSNTARYRGGGLYTTEVLTLALLFNSRVEFNRATDLTTSLGGGAFFTASWPLVQEAFFTGNRAQQGGGAIYSENSQLALYRTVISGNVAQGYDGSGGVEFRGMNSTGAIYNNLFHSNHSRNGGGLYNAGKLETGYNQFTRNDAYYGGGIYNEKRGTLSLIYTTFEQNDGGSGAGLYSNGRIGTSRNLTFTQNQGAWEGGGFYWYTSTSTSAIMTNVVFLNNEAAVGDGGGLFISGKITLTLFNAMIVGNQVEHDGAGVYAYSANLHIYNGTITDNKVDGTDSLSSGGGLYMTGTSKLTLNNVQVDRNRIDHVGKGGGLHLYGTTATLNNITLNDNLASGAAQGGGLYLENGSATINGLTASGNLGAYSGGGLDVRNATLNLSNANIHHNGASATGGGINAYKTTLALNNVTIRDHDSGTANGAGIECYDCEGVWQNVTLSHNLADGNGGGLRAYQAALTLQNATFEGNTSNEGGGIYNDDTTLQLINVTLSGNQATAHGGGLYNGDGTVAPSVISLTNVTLKDNGSGDGGGIYNFNAPDTLAYLKNTVIADSPAGSNCKGKGFASSKYSLSSDNTCSLSGTGDQNNVAAKLNPLSWVGGPNKVHLPLPDSPVVDMVIGSDFPGTDQRGLSRAQGAGADAGSVERQATDPIYGLLVYLPLVIK
ncbi:putative outer membrane protein PmpB [Thermoflexales bacterium]|nr:putative outer membrane protein PmpB [Thermoflexales bacterium]